MSAQHNLTAGTQPVRIAIDGITLDGDLHVPHDARGLVLFAHGSGSSRHSHRNRFVAESLNGVGLAALLFDLLTADEEMVDRRTAQLRFDIRLLADRLVGATDWVCRQSDLSALGLGYFGASTGAAAAVFAAAERPDLVRAVVSRGGRPDLAAPVLEEIVAPTLLIVGGNDVGVIEVNRLAYDRLNAEKRLAIVPGATHLFEEPGALEQVAELAGEWFLSHLPTA
ncbi:MAG TPA: hypothetical protein PL151_02455 [Phycisphaerae bacterium]|nr:hypothetical protein [Phycisphaerae bacterium]HOJ74385.1 hypothetical protein [Phycisphaerae bacterium]HOM53009.1 hypothetical protein [Phycisphaerae bacterium]HON68273.1 hypothetical protein [Phycisphaerae bacterium]HOQ85777.1 hypothetical protein [Phycisphaerae bacterium]